ncbi:MAG TPA: amidohydrolase [Microscillaceae bacterium]|nr:amidohydrolase [Microscillaceae bacterium]
METRNKLNQIILSLAILCGVVLNSQAQRIKPAAPQSQPIVLQGATIHVGDGQVIDKGSIRFEKGIITEVGTNVNTSGAQVISLAGKHIYPGVIAPNTSVGLIEIGAVRASVDNSEQGSFNPEARALTSFNTDSDVIPTLRFTGVLIAESVPSGGIVSGTASVMEMDGWNWEDAVHKADHGIHLNWVSRFGRRGRVNRRRARLLKVIENTMNEARAYVQNPKPAKTNLKFEAMRGLFDGSSTLFVHANYSKDIVESVQKLKSYGVKRIVIVGGREALKVAGFLRDEKVPVILSETHRLPRRSHIDVDMPFKLPYLLAKAGVLTGLSVGGWWQVRTLPFQAGTAVAHGLKKEEALQMITLNNAKILGIDDKVGSLVKGKHATLIVSKGDILDMLTNDVEHAFIRGKKIILDDKQQQLYKRFKKKYDSQKK